MRGIEFAGGAIRLRDDLPTPSPSHGHSIVRVLRAGICATDLALRAGYMEFEGVPGHEFVGVVEDGPRQGQRVVGDINAACGECARCRTGMEHHCSARTVLGILGHSGAFAEQIQLPNQNLYPVPDSVSDDAATFAEPVAAAFEIVEQLAPSAGTDCLVVGDGKLGLLCAMVLHAAGLNVTVAGRHAERKSLLPSSVQFDASGRFEQDRADAPVDRRYPIAVEATGNADVLPRLFGAVEPRGTIVLKTTTERPTTLDLAPLVVDEIQLVGSRCGPIARAIGALERGEVDVEPLVEARYELKQANQALDHAARRGTLKVLLEI